MILTHRRTPLHRHWAVWLALCVALVMALAPTVSHALVWSQGDGGHYMEICTATGPSLVGTDSTSSLVDSPVGQESTLSLSHCPFCLHASDRVFPPPHPVAYHFVDAGRQQEAVVWQALFLLSHCVFVPPPRGPPTYS